MRRVALRFPHQPHDQPIPPCRTRKRPDRRRRVVVGSAMERPPKPRATPSRRAWEQRPGQSGADFAVCTSAFRVWQGLAGNQARPGAGSGARGGAADVSAPGDAVSDLPGCGRSGVGRRTGCPVRGGRSTQAAGPGAYQSPLRKRGRRPHRPGAYRLRAQGGNAHARVTRPLLARAARPRTREPEFLGQPRSPTACSPHRGRQRLSL